MKCKYCGNEFKYKPNKQFCRKSCRQNFYKRTKLKCLVCGNPIEIKHATKYCSTECARVGKLTRQKNERDQRKTQEKYKEELKIASYNLYDKQYNSNIERCLNCKKDDCDGECEYINTLIQG